MRNLWRMIIVIAIIFLVFFFLSNMNENLAFIKKHQEKEEQRMDKLNSDLRRLENVVMYQHQLIQELEQPKNITIVEKPIKEEKVKESNNFLEPNLIPLTLVGISQVLKSLLKPSTIFGL